MDKNILTILSQLGAIENRVGHLPQNEILKAERSERQKQREQHAALNASIQTRQVILRNLFQSGFAETTRLYSVPRKQRRRIALSSMHRAWKESR